MCYHELIVVGSHGRSTFGRMLFGSISQDVLSHSPCSVGVARDRRSAGAGVRVLLAVDGSPDAAAAVDAICSRKWPAGTQVRVVTTVDARLGPDLLRAESRDDTASPAQRLVHDIAAKQGPLAPPFATAMSSSTTQIPTTFK